MYEAHAHAWQVFLRKANNRFIDIAKHGSLDGGVLDNFAKYAAITAADDEDALRIGMRVHGEVSDHFLVTVRLAVRFRIVSAVKGEGRRG